MTSMYSWDVIAANNANADSDINWAEGQLPSTVNDSARQMMAASKQLLIDLGGSIATGGSTNARTLTSSSPFTTLANGRVVTFRSHTTNTGATTLNVNAIGAKPVLIALNGGIMALTGGELVSGAMYTAMYSEALNSGSGAWLVTNPTSVSPIAPGTVVNFAGTTAPAGWLLCYGQAVSRTTYAALFAAIGTTYGPGNGSTTFNLPDARGRTAAGKDNMGGAAANRLTNAGSGITGTTLGAVGGSQSHTLTTAQLPSHTHTGTTASGGSHTHSISGTAASSGSAHSHSFSGSTDNDGAHTHILRANAGATFDVGNPYGTGRVAGTVSADGTVVQSSGAHSHNFSGTTASGGAHTHTVSGSAASGGAHTHTFTTAATGSGSAHPNVQPTIVFNTIIKT